ncbi:MAG: ATP-dependent helicase HrpB [Hyphomicrobiales bacterium]|nr:MAG: ATP-dependent helicase HrpB [Hyphomicrobiales bacterium]
MRPAPLPVDAAIPDLLAALDAQPSAVLVAPPGAGKTTRVPLALFEADWRGDERIIVLEPRRLAARAAARRMAETLGEKVGETVGYRVRMDARISVRTRIEVVTEGVFTRMILDDPELSGVAAVLFDEFHERSLDGDLGLALALDAQGALRPDLRLVVMSATVDGARVAGLLGDAPVIASEGKMYPVDTIYISRNSALRIEDDMTSAILRACREEAGSVLAFLPGRGEIERTAERLRDKVPATVSVHTLYGAMEGKDQDAAIRPAPGGSRKIVLATAIAETSLTIDGVTVVVDSGLARKPRYEPATGMTRLETMRVSRAAADQRRGRAGRTASGRCYRLWDEGQTAALAPYDRPEILEADLCNLVLDLAAWGVTDPAALTWLDPPPAPAWSEAVALLRDLEAIDVAGHLTDEGRALSRLPLHPRLAHMIHRASDKTLFEPGAVRTAARIAVTVSEHALGGTDTDLRERLRRLAREGGRASEARRLADRWAKLAGAGGGDGGTSDADAGRLLALAYPDRVAEARGAPGAYRLANGRGARLDPADPLAREKYLAVAEVQGSAQAGRILLAAPLDKSDIEELFADHIDAGTSAEFDAGSGSVRARRTRRFGRVVLDAAHDPLPDPDRVAEALLAGIAAKGLGCLPWTDDLTRLRARIGFLHRDAAGEGDNPWPDMSDTALAEGLAGWLGPFIAGKTALAQIKPGDLKSALDAMIPWDRKADLDRLAPPRVTVPTGRSIAVDYAAEAGPSVSVKVQELYGLAEHPTVGVHRIPLVLELLSPAQRPVQVTRDLPGFWRGSWADVRRDMRGRYPKHDWPEDPANAHPQRGAKPRKQ